MSLWRRQYLTWLFMAGCMAPNLMAQDLRWDDTTNSIVFRPVFSKMPGYFRLRSGLDYNFSVSGNLLTNGDDDKTASQIVFIQNLKYSFRLSSSRFLLTNELVHNLGLLCYIDSISKFQTDENTLTTRISYDVAKSLKFTASSILTTRIFNGWEVSQSASGTTLKTITSSFLTPLICNFSGGFGLSFFKSGMLDIGISSCKLTYICDRSIFDKTGLDKYYGVIKGRNSFLEYGLSLHLLIDRLIGRKLQWNCDLLLFKAGNSAVDMTFKNLFAFRINRYLKSSLQTRLFYDKDVSMLIRMENLLSFGFDFHL